MAEGIATALVVSVAPASAGHAVPAPLAAHVAPVPARCAAEWRASCQCLLCLRHQFKPCAQRQHQLRRHRDAETRDVAASLLFQLLLLAAESLQRMG